MTLTVRLALGSRLLVLCLGLIVAGCERDAPTVSTGLYPPGPVTVLGLDGLDAERVAQWEKAGRLPNFARLRERGAVGVVRSTLPMNAASTWFTVATGVRPGEHGIWGFGSDDAGDLRFTRATDRLAPAIWNELSERGRTVGVFGVPVTSPPDSVNGFQVSGFPRVRGAALAFPPEVAEDVVRRAPEFITVGPVAGAEAAWLADVRRARDARRDLVLELRRTHPTELLFAVFDSPALVQRYGLGSDDLELANAVAAEYEWIDALVGTFLDAMTPDETLLVVSNRGFQSATRGISAAWCARLPEGVRVGARASRFEEGGWFVDSNATANDVEAYRAALESLEDDGRRCFRAVHDLSKQELRGHAAPIGPRIVAEPADEFAIVSGAADSSRFVPIASPGSVGVPRRRGYFAMLGRFVEPGAVRDFDLGDVAAIVMHRLGEAIPRRYVHNVPRRMFPLDYFVARPMRFSGRPEDELRRPSSRSALPGDDGIEAQVRGLGYVR